MYRFVKFVGTKYWTIACFLDKNRFQLFGNSRIFTLVRQTPKELSDFECTAEYSMSDDRFPFTNDTYEKKYINLTLGKYIHPPDVKD